MTRLPFSAAGSTSDFSRLVFGTWRLLGDPAIQSPQDFLAVLKACLDVGITTIDTAEIYGLYKVEEMLGRALALDSGVRSKLEIISKYGIYAPCEFHPDRKTAFYNADGARAVKSAEKSLRLLGVDALDVLLVHRPDWLSNPADTAAGLLELVKSGKVKAVGVSNYSPSQVRALQAALGDSTRLVTNQVEFSPFHLDPLFDGAFDQCQELKMRPMAWSPTGGGKLFGSDESAVRVRAVLAAMRERYEGLGDDALCYAWILRHPVECFTILGTTKAERIRAAARACEVEIGREDWYAITEAARGARIP
jgi:predicted oxidoreductase